MHIENGKSKKVKITSEFYREGGGGYIKKCNKKNILSYFLHLSTLLVYKMFLNSHNKSKPKKYNEILYGVLHVFDYEHEMKIKLLN